MAIKLSELMQTAGSPQGLQDMMGLSKFTQFNPISFGPSEQVVPEQQAAPQAEQKQEPSIFDKLSKAFKSYGQAVSTPGFQQVLGQLGAALAPNPESWQAKLGQVGAQMGASEQYNNYVQKLIAGQPITPADIVGMNPEQQLQARLSVDTMKREQAQQGLAEKSQAASQKYMEGQVGVQQQAQKTNEAELGLKQQEVELQRDALMKGQWDVATIPAGGENEFESFLYNRTTGVKVPMGRGKKATSEGAGAGGLTPYQRFRSQLSEYDRMIRTALLPFQSQGISVYLDQNGMTQVDIPKGAPKQVAEAAQKAIRDVVVSGIQAGKFDDGFLGYTTTPGTPAPVSEGQQKKTQWP